jgi:hypothetical protein
MNRFYYKHYAASTPRWLHWLVLSGITLGEWRTRLREALHPRRPRMHLEAAP